MSELPETLKGEIDRTIESLSRKKFAADPIAGRHFSKIVSLMSSAYKRHGFIIERALLDTLQQYDRFIAWDNREFSVPVAADSAVDHLINTPEQAFAMNLQYGDQHRTLQVDLFAYDKETKSLTSYEVKRGSGLHDAGKRRSILRDLLCLQLLTKSYGESLGYEVANARAYIIFYYGKCSIGRPFALTKDDLDAHFGVPVVDDIEVINAYFQQRLFSILSNS